MYSVLMRTVRGTEFTVVVEAANEMAALEAAVQYNGGWGKATAVRVYAKIR